MARSAVSNRSQVANRSAVANRTTILANGITSRILVNSNYAGISSNPVLYFSPWYGMNYDGSNNISSWLDNVSGWAAKGSGTGRPTIAVNAFGTGKPGVLFDGSNDVLTFITNAALTGNKNWTMFAVVKPNSLTGLRVITSIGGNTVGYGFAINLNGTGKRELQLKAVSFPADGAATTNAEIWCASCNNAGSPTQSFSVNGVEQGVDVSATPITPLTGGSLGANYTAGFYSGYLGTFLVYNTELSAGDKTTVINKLNSDFSIF